MGRRGGESPATRRPLRTLLRPPGRQTNQALLVVLLFTFVTGVATVAIGSPHGAWVAIGHGICGLAVVLLIPWKSRVVRGGLRRARLTRWLSLLLATLALFTLIAGLGYATGLVRSIAGMPGLWVHIAVALLLVPLVVWHVWARGIRRRRADLSRRALLRAGVLAVGAAGLYAVGEATVRVLGLPGVKRRFTGSYETASFRPEAMPSTSWLLDAVPGVDPDRWRLTVKDGQGPRELTLAQLTAYDTQVRATLDCTSGWYSHQDWTGVPAGHVAPPRTGNAKRVRALGHRLLGPLADPRPGSLAARHAGGRRAPLGRSWVPGAPCGPWAAGVLVGQVGRPYRGTDHTVVAAAAIPHRLTLSGQQGVRGPRQI
jgi:hypothetical protein